MQEVPEMMDETNYLITARQSISLKMIASAIFKFSLGHREYSNWLSRHSTMNFTISEWEIRLAMLTVIPIGKIIRQERSSLVSGAMSMLIQKIYRHLASSKRMLPAQIIS